MEEEDDVDEQVPASDILRLLVLLFCCCMVQSVSLSWWIEVKFWRFEVVCFVVLFFSLSFVRVVLLLSFEH